MFRIVFESIFILWGLSEVAIGLLFRTKVEGEKDAGTMRLVLTVAYASVAVAAFLGFADDGVLVEQTPVAAAGLAMIVLGMLIRFWAIATLRRFFTVNVTLRDDHRLVRTGPYRWIRHPSYTGTLLSFYGLAVALENVWAAIVCVVPITYAFLVRMRVEEAILRNAFPEEYPAYERETRRLVPFVY
jgi:protein-S-isoprenylcysteine O-methyltransferase